MAERLCARSLRASRAPSRTPLVEPLETRALFSGAGPLVITEFMADNSTGLADQDLEFHDWIEIHNPTASPVNLDGYSLTDDDALLTKWQFPSTSIPANGYLVVFASDKDRAFSGQQLHTNFKLSDTGEYLALVHPDGVTVSDEYSPKFPEQVENVSYGVFNGAERYFTSPTPGPPNTAGSAGVVSDTGFSVDRGFYDTAFQLRIGTLTPGATIRFTTDGTLPSPTRGVIYSSPLLISRSMAVRAIAYKTGMVPSDVDTQTYIFVDDVVRQTPAATMQAGFPSTWGSVTPDYGMDPDVIGQTGPDLFGGVYAATIRDDLKAIPTMSIVLPVADMFGPNGIYSNSTARGDQWERATSVELIDPTNGAGDTEFQVNAGIQIQGGAFRGDGLTKKHSFRLLFKDRWGVSKLNFPIFGPDSADSFDSITLRADANDGWQWSGAGGEALYSRDLWSRMTQRAMGHPGADGARVHLYINGIYWGIYNPTERPDAAFASTYFGGDKDDWDAYNQDGVTDGTSQAWNTMLSIASEVQNAFDEESRTEAYQRLQGNNPDGTDNPAYEDYLDVDSLIDYMLLNIFTGNADWPHRNWYAARLRADDGIGTDATGMKFFSWDAESALDLWADLNSNRTNVNQGPAQPYAMLRSSPEFRARFAERVQLHMFGNGALSTAANKARMAEITSQIDRAIVAESARWGDQHRNPPYTRADWANTRDTLLAEGGYFDQRWPIVLSQLRAAGLYGNVAGPNLTPGGGQSQPGMQVLIGNASGTVYYTLDGSDPRLPDGSVNPAATVVTTTGGTVLPFGSEWRFLDDGSDQGTAWVATDYDDSWWGAGRGQLGYGDGDETTPLGYGPNAGNKYITTYFRKTFTVANPSQYSNLRLRVLRDDGAVVYLNGQELTRSHMPGGAINYLTTAPGAIEDTTFEYALDPARLRAGDNVLAVEIHQSGGNSSDLSFDLELAAPTPSIPVTLPGGTVRLLARSRDLAGNWSALADGLYHAEPLASAANVAVTEVNYHPHNPEPDFGETLSTDPGDYEFVELMNTSDRRVTLHGAKFNFGIKFEFPVGTYLDPGERAVVVKNLAAFRSRYGDGPRVLGTFTGNLGNDGQLTIFQDARGQLIDSFRYSDSGSWPGRADGGGASLEVIDPNGDYNDSDNWRPSREYGGTPGAPGSGPVPGVVINEVLANTDVAQLDRVELFNPTPSPVNIGGWYLSDSSANYRKFRIPLGTTLQPGAHIVFDETALGFSLDGEGDDVWLVRADPADGRLLSFADRIEFGPTALGESLGRWPSGSPGAGFYPMNPTLGTPNNLPRTGTVVINEIHYSPATGGQEFVELFNPTASPVSLTGWRFTDGIEFAFPDTAAVPAGGYLLLVAGDASAFASANGVPAAVPVIGGFTIAEFLNVLDNAGEKLTLKRPGTAPAGQDVPMIEVDSVRFDDAAPWQVLADGDSLARRSTTGWSQAAVNWGAESPGGSPGRVNFGGAPAQPFVAGRHVFHNNSSSDGRSSAAGHLDDYAAANKQALLPGQRGGFANVTSSPRGINGLMVDIANLPAGGVTAADFDLFVGNGSTWTAAPAPTSVTVRRGAGTGGSDRVTLTFADNAIRNTWLRVSAKPNARTGLTSSDVFYFGSLPGETGDAARGLAVTSIDLARTRQNLFTRNPALIARYDFNADGVVSAADLLIARNNQGRSLSQFTAPAGALAGVASREAAILPTRTTATRRTDLGATDDLLA